MESTQLENDNHDFQMECAEVESAQSDTKLEEDSSEDEYELEPWIDWIKRVTREMDIKLEKLGIDSWDLQVRKRKWKWAFKLQNTNDNRWSKVALNWNPLLHFDGNIQRAYRKQSRPRSRWTDDFTKFASKEYDADISWEMLNNDEHFWQHFESKFSEKSESSSN